MGTGTPAKLVFDVNSQGDRRMAFLGKAG